MLGLGLLGAGSSYLQQQEQQKNQNAQNELAAAKDRTSYITGRGGQLTTGAGNPYQALLAGGMTGATQGMAFSQQQNANALKQDQMDAYKRILDQRGY